MNASGRPSPVRRLLAAEFRLQRPRLVAVRLGDREAAVQELGPDRHLRLGVQRDEAVGVEVDIGALAAAHPDKLTYNHHFDPRNGEVGLEQLRLRASAAEAGVTGWVGDHRR